MKLTAAEKKKQKDLYTKMVDVPYKEKAKLNVSIDDLKDIKDWDVGKTYILEVKAKMSSKSEGGWDGNEPMRATFDVEAIKSDRKNKIDDYPEGVEDGED